jgi:hypothetical protein
MRHSLLISTILLVLVATGCGRKQADVGQAEQKVANAQSQLEQAKQQAGAEQRVADLEKQLEAAKKDLAAAKGEAPATAPSPAPAPPQPVEPPPPPKPKECVIPAGTAIPVRTMNALSTKTATTGSPFQASLTKALVVDGVVLAPAGANATGVVVLSDSGGRVKGKASISIGLKSIATSNGPVAVATNSYEVEAKSTVKKDVVRGGIMTGAGAAIGAIAGGGKGAAIGAGIGGAAGVGTAMATKGAPAEIPAESLVTFTLKSPVTVTIQP